MPERFEGFPPRGLRFLRDLEKHNDRAWFAPRKEIYQEDVLLPMQQLVIELSECFARKRLPVFGDVRRSIFRIYRDVRFSNDKRPYKAHASAYLSPDGGRHTPGGLYVHIAPKESFIGIAFYQMDKRLVHRWRTAMAENPAAFRRVLSALKRSKLNIQLPGDSEDALTRMPRGFTHLSDHPLAPYFRLRHFVVHESLSPAEVGSRKLLDRAVRFVERSKSLLAYGWKLASEVEVTSERDRVSIDPGDEFVI